MNPLQYTPLGNPLLAWATALGGALGVLVVLILLRRFGLRRLARFAERTSTEWDDLLVAVLKSTRFLTLVVIAVSAGAQALELSARLERIGRTGSLLVLLLQGAIWATAAVNFILIRNVQRKVGNDVGGTTTLKAIGLAAKLVIWSIFLLMVLGHLGINVTGLLAGLGIGGVAIALALQNILGDLFASLSIVLDKPFEVGDFIIVGDFLGSVERIGLKTTRLRSLSGEQIVFGNHDLLGSRVRNFKRMEERRVLFNLTVPFSTPRSRLAAIAPMLREIIEAQDGIRFDRAHFQGIGEFAYRFEAVYFVLTADYNRYMDIQQAISLEIVARFEAAGLAFAFPARSLFHERGGPVQPEGERPSA